MLLIGFVWCLVGVAAGVVSKSFCPGKWEDSGPIAMLVASAGSFMGGMVAVFAMEGPNSFGPPLSGSTVGVVASIIGGVVAFGAFAVDARRAAAKA